MSVVHNTKRRTNDICDGAPKGRGRRADKARSRYVLTIAAWVVWAGIVVGGLLSWSTSAVDLSSVICHEPRVSRASVADAKLKEPADASLTIWWRQFYQA
ncbi:hypothetical protein SSBR45G_37970 [Bradyrhizobium sp. SSBR45G]|nr:hypothetical protein SSBR45G_37970 [Bradyrhizobium sp. SSBR45G]GLH86398.1 hypothetical protein SSBR45R_38580 [Bradyrhizobium sp. SSBR45R]